MSQLALFANLPRSPRRGRPVTATSESIRLLGQAYAKLLLAAESRGHLDARHFIGRAADLLRRAGARDIATVAYRALDESIGHPDVEHILNAIDRRIANRSLRSAGVS